MSHSIRVAPVDRRCVLCGRAVEGSGVPIVQSDRWRPGQQALQVDGLAHMGCIALQPAAKVLDGWKAIEHRVGRSRRWCAYMGLPVRKVGGMVQIGIAELDAWLASAPQGSPPAHWRRKGR